MENVPARRINIATVVGAGLGAFLFVSAMALAAAGLVTSPVATVFDYLPVTGFTITLAIGLLHGIQYLRTLEEIITTRSRVSLFHRAALFRLTDVSLALAACSVALVLIGLVTFLRACLSRPTW